MKIGLFLGSFNPIHIGHLIVANYVLESTGLDKIWFVVSPHNPLKDKNSLLDEGHRLNMVKLAIAGNENFTACEVEMLLPRPSYTINTLTHLATEFPENQFVLVMGSDNLETFDKWKEYKSILEKWPVYFYPRKSFNEKNIGKYSNTRFVPAPEMEISSTFIRNSICEGRDIQYLVPLSVSNYINEMKLYK
jgi:nicotinate-nucleotide adenylyltransferase